MIDMGLFSRKTDEEKEQIKQEKAAKKESRVMFTGDALQPIGKIPMNGPCGITLKPSERVLKIHHDKIDITLPYERIRSFKVENETTLAKSGSGLGGAVIGGVLFGGVGAIVGQSATKGKTKTKWIGTLTYEDKEGNTQELYFVERGLTGLYDGDQKSYSSSQFEQAVNNIASNVGENITEL